MSMDDIPNSSDPAKAAHDASPSLPLQQPISEADLHGYVDGQLAPARRTQVGQYLAGQPEERERVREWQRQNELLRAHLDPVLDEPLPLRLPLVAERSAWPWRAIAASVAGGVVIAVASAGAAWTVRGGVDADAARLAFATVNTPVDGATGTSTLAGFAHRAAVAHAVYSPDARRPVELGADQEQALVTWLTKRMGAAVKAPVLGKLGYELIGGRLLPGGKGPVAQFMYGTSAGERLTLYVTREVAGQDAGFQFTREGPVNVFYWVDDHFGYAISAGADRATLTKVSEEVYRQLKGG
jgi:anti-sigma factor RsiW